MTDSIPLKGPDDVPSEGAGKLEVLEVAQHTDHPPEAELRNPSPSASAVSAPAGGWERKVFEKVLMVTVRERRAARRWHIFFRLVALGLIGVLIYAFASLEGETVSTGRYTAIVTLEDEIAANTNASAENINASLQAAFADDSTVGVILKTNSPGDSPMQTSMTNDEIRRFRVKYKKIPLYVVIEEMCASGGYYVAAATDKIYVDKANIVGSIGVLMDGFGFTGLMDRVGVECRLLTAGSNKGMLDPFSSVSPQQKQYVQGMLDQVHRQFIDVVKQGRGDRLKGDPTLFTGLFWTGVKAVDLGLADAISSSDFVARSVVKAPGVVDYTVKENFASRVARKLGVAMEAGAVKALATTGQLKLLMKE